MVLRSLALVTSPAVLLAALALAPRAAVAQDRVVFGFDGAPGEAGVPRPWRFRKWAPLVGWDYEATARVDQDGGRKVLYVKSVRSGFIVGTEREVDVASLKNVSWSWKAETLPRGGSFKRRGTNDQALQILLGFDGGKVLGYVWDSTGSPGASGSGLAFREDVRVIVLEAGPAKVGTWVAEKRDVVADFTRLFGAAPPRMKGVAIQSNSQHTGTTGSGWVGPITFSR